MQRLVALVLCGTLLSSACATVTGARTAPPSPPHAPRGVDPALIAGYVRQLPVGSRVRVSLADGRTVRGTLMYPERDPIVVQRRARIPEAPVEIPVKDILAVEPETGKSGSAVRAIAIGAAAAAGATLGVIGLLAAIFAD